MTEELVINNDVIDSLERKAAEIAIGGASAKSTSVDGVSVSTTMQDPGKVIDVANAIAKRKAAKRGILSQIRFLKVKDQP